MKLAHLARDRRAVSPVIGVVLMVAITVILAAVIGTFVLGLSDSADTTPSASFTFDTYDDDSDDDPDAVLITHESGDTFLANTLEIQAAGDTLTWGSEVSAGDTYVLADSGGASGISQDGTLSSTDVSGETVRVVYVDPDGDGSSLLAGYEVKS